VTRPQPAPDDPTFLPLTMREVLELTGRSRRTVKRWIDGGHITPYEAAHRREVIFAEYEVVDVEKRMHDADMANKERIRARGGRPGPRVPKQPNAVDAPA
jgi:hypothetical protein